MHRSHHFITFILAAFFCIVIVLATALPASGQNAVPPTARQAAALPEFASRLSHQVTPQAAGKRRAWVPGRSHRVSPQDQVIYENGPVNGTTDAWTINFGYVVSDSFTGGNVTGFDFYAWEFPGDGLSSVDWSITDSPNGGTVYGSGTVSGNNLTDTYISTNQFGYNIDHISASGLNVSTGSGTFYLNLQNAAVPSGDPVYWDENSGIGCQSQGCPSQAYESGLGTIASESFDVVGNGPECVHNVPKDGFKIIHSFTGGSNGASPGGIAIDKVGNLYGVAWGGDNGFGLAYSLKGQNWTFNNLYSFTGGYNGQSPISAPIVGPDGSVYGGASGGLQNCPHGDNNYCGLVYNLRPSPSACLTSLCPWTENVPYRFQDGTDAFEGVVVGSDQAGNLFGFSSGLLPGGAYGKGAVFELTPSSGGWTEKVIYSFTGSDGDGVNALLVGSDGNLYGTTFWSWVEGYHGGGVVFQLVPSGGSWTEQVIANFGFGQCTYYSGCSPVLVQENSGNLYVLDSYDEYYQNSYYDYWDQYGTISMVSPSDGKWQVTLLDDRANYYNPYYGLQDSGYDLFYDLAIDAAGRIFMTEGTEVCCYEYGGGVFELPAPQHDRVLVGFGGDNFSNVEAGANANLYGTTSGCGSYGKGTVWELTPQN